MRGHKRSRSSCVCDGVNLETEASVQCESCFTWFHFHCIGLSEIDAEDLALFVCAGCTTTTGPVILMFWDDTNTHQLQPNAHDAVGSMPQDGEHVITLRSKPLDPSRRPLIGIYPDESEESMSSDDNYTEDSEDSERERGTLRKRDTEKAFDRNPTLVKRSRRPAGAGGALRQTRSPTGVATKSQERSDGGVVDDPVRKYCYSKLLDVILPIFQEHAIQMGVVETSRSRSDFVSSSDGIDTSLIDPAGNRATDFVNELEQRIFDMFGEYDEKKRRTVASGRYRERFRMLSFNLSQKDRVSLRRKIGTGEISAGEVAKMSSADLANEERQHEIELARRESLQHSILEAPVVPTAKITHKGEEIIETSFSSHDSRRPELPSFEAPASEGHSATVSSERLYTLRQMSNEPSSQTPVGSLGHEGRAPTPQPSMAFGSASPFPSPSSAKDTDASRSAAARRPVSVGFEKRQVSPTVTETSAPAISPALATNPQFSLNSLWNATEEGTNRRMSGDSPELQSAVLERSLQDDFLDSLDDSNLDDLLAPEDGVTVVSKMEELPPEGRVLDWSAAVWTGPIVMPMDPSPAISCKVGAWQIAGPRLEKNPSTWSRLFTTPAVRIDGRVPVMSSAQYLLTMRMSTNKELVAVSFAPQGPSEEASFTALVQFLSSRGRHGIVFPWGAKPSEMAIGKDLYLIPLKANEPIPEFVQLLDHLELTPQRSSDIIIGIFVLYKDRVPRPSNHPPTLEGHVLASQATPHSLWGSSTTPTPSPSQSGFTQTNPSNIATDIAGLSPEQLRLVHSLIRQAGLADSGPSTTALPGFAIEPLAASRGPQIGSLDAYGPHQGQDLASIPAMYPTDELYRPSTPVASSVNTSRSPDRNPHASISGTTHGSAGPGPGRHAADRDYVRRRRSSDRPRDSGWGSRGRERGRGK